jgi:dihydroorotate dehydrogenase electron transfer subunit
MLEETVSIVSNERDVDHYHRLVVRAPKIAPRVQPGQFAHVRVLPMREALLRRPFSIFQVEQDAFSVLYKVVGRGTDRLSRMRSGETLSALGPLGHGFSQPGPAQVPLLVAGGYGMAALYLLAQRSPVKGIVFVGGRRKIDILCEKEFADLGWDVRVATEDGSHGVKALVTEPLQAELGRDAEKRALFACGPTPMLRAVGRIAEQFQVPTELSMDEPMCCGVGVCLTCVIPVKTEGGWEYQRTCTEGPVFDARAIAWEAFA